jgi:hypothetical protein
MSVASHRADASLFASFLLTPDALLSVVVSDCSCLGVVSSQSLLESLCVVIGTLNKIVASNVIFHRLLGGAAQRERDMRYKRSPLPSLELPSRANSPEFLVVASATSRVDQSTSNARNEKLIPDLQFYSEVKLL